MTENRILKQRLKKSSGSENKNKSCSEKELLFKGMCLLSENRLMGFQFDDP